MMFFLKERLNIKMNWATYLMAGCGVILIVNMSLKICYKYWARRNVPYLKPDLIFGNIKSVVMQEESVVEHNHKLYKLLAPNKYGGYFRFQRPVLMIRDPDLIKQILVKDFNYFSDRNKHLARDSDILSNHLFNLTGTNWKYMRNKLNTSFKNNILEMFDTIQICSNLSKEEIAHFAECSPEFELKSLITRYAMRVISVCAFGLNEGQMNNFESMTKRMFENGLQRKIFTTLNLFSPKFSKYIGASLFDKNFQNSFLKMVSEIINFRELNGINKNDFLRHLMDMKKQDLGITTETIAAQVFGFFMGGFETPSNILCFCILELAKNQDIQENLRKEITEFIHANSKLTYDGLKTLSYLDKVVSETIRLYPAAAVYVRQCTLDYKIADTNTIIEKGTEVFIPVYGLHHDDKYYQTPEKFNPEHFCEDAVNSRHQFTYLPFGKGPRMCIAYQFGILQIKLGLVTFLSDYKFTVSPKTIYPVSFRKHTTVISSAEDIWLICSRCK